MEDRSALEQRRQAELRNALASLLGTDDPSAIDELRGHLERVELRRGETLYRQGDVAHDLHIVASGTLRVMSTDARGRSTAIAEIRRGQTVGEMAILEGTTRTATVFAVRDCVLLRLDRSKLERVVESHPRLVLNISRLMSSRLRRTTLGRGISERYRTIAVVPHGGIEGIGTARRLADELGLYGRAALVDSEPVDDRVEDLEAAHDSLVLLADGEPTPWTRTCLSHADAVVLVAEFDADASVGPVERWLGDQDAFERLPRRELVLLHPPGSRGPSGTARWLEGRRVDRHHHVRADRAGDLARVARYAAGRAVGLVLAGGGAPGFAHVGVIRALRERGIPIDAVGGTSIGAIVAAGVALDFDDEQLYRACRESFTGSDPLGDYNLIPVVSVSRGGRIERRLREHLGEGSIEDCWIPFFCISANLSSNEQHVHQSGPLWRAVRTSCSIPGIVPPMVHDGQLHIDGSCVNNLPVDVFQRAGMGRVIASDLDLRVDRRLDYEKVPSPWRVLAGRLVPGVSRVPVPGPLNVVMKSTMLGGAERAARVREEVDLCFVSPVQRIGLLRWSAFDDAVAVGYRHAAERLGPDSVALLRGVR